jgi:hypothetical protein
MATSGKFSPALRLPAIEDAEQAGFLPRSE